MIQSPRTITGVSAHRLLQLVPLLLGITLGGFFLLRLLLRLHSQRPASRAMPSRTSLRTPLCRVAYNGRHALTLPR